MDKQKILIRLFSGNKQLPALPVLFGQLKKMMEDPFVSNKKIAELIRKDQSMVAKILKLSNSAIYGKRQEITNLSYAITFLGATTIRNLIMQILLVRVFNLEGEGIPGFNVNTFWEHSLGTAYFTEIIVKKLKLPPNDDYYIAGLLHDLGKLPLRAQFPAVYHRVWDLARRHTLQLYQSEIRHLGLDHCDVGQLIAQKWRLGCSLVESLSYHHNPAGSSEKNRDFVSMVCLANQWVNEFSIGSAGNHAVDQSLVARLIGEVGLDWARLAHLRETVIGEIDKAKIFLDILRND